MGIVKNNLIRAQLLFRHLFLKQSGAPFILMYHRVLNLVHSDYFIQPGMFVTPKTFEMHLGLLGQKYNVLPLRELLEGFYVEKQSMVKCCSITFDDGWRDNYTNAFPLLKKYNTPASIFLATGYAGGDLWFWEEEVAFFLHQNSRQNIVSLFKSNLNASQYKKIANIAWDITGVIYLMKQLPEEHRVELVRLVSMSNKSIRNKKRMVISWDEAREMQEESVDVFSHSHSHRLLTGLAYDEVLKDISTSLTLLSEELDNKQDVFCYPSGKFTDDIIEILKNNGIKYALTTQRSSLAHSKEIFSIPRIGMHNDISCTPALFKFNLP